MTQNSRCENRAAASMPAAVTPPTRASGRGAGDDRRDHLLAQVVHERLGGAVLG